MVDPGHGGIDSGTKSGSGQDEKDVVLAFGLTLRDKLVKTGKYRVAMTRSDDTFIPLDERVRFARAHKAALFISIHADSIPRSEGQAEGASVYTLSGARFRRRSRAACRSGKQIRRDRRRRL